MLRKQRSGSVKNHEARLTDEAAKAILYSAFRYDRRSLAAGCMLLLATAAFDNQDAATVSATNAHRRYVLHNAPA